MPVTTKVGINEFGRIGRLVFRAMADDPEVEVVAVNDLGEKATAAHLLKYDSIHGIRNFDIEVVEDGLIVDGKHVTMLSDRNPENLPWGELGVDVVVEATGIFKTGELAQKHLDAGAKKVVITCLSRFLFFAVVLLFTLRPTRIVDIVGKVLTPVLVAGIVIMVVAGIVNPLGPVVAPESATVVADGISAGYQAMGILAVVGFAIIVQESVRAAYADPKSQLSVTARASLVACVLLTLVYGGLTYLGARPPRWCPTT